MGTMHQMPPPTLTPAEIEDITHYKRPAEQLRALREMGIAAQRRRDNTICVMRFALAPRVEAPPARPQLKFAKK